MGTMKIRNIEIEPDFLEELEPYMDKLGKHRLRDSKLQACSPFRYEKSPSFAVNLDNGSWVDSGAVDEYTKKGHFTHLLSFLREETWTDTEDYLLSKYSTIVLDVDTLQLEYNLAPEVPYKIFSKEELAPFMYRVSYLTNRGISEKVQRAFGIGYDREGKAIMIPWRDWRGNVINTKFRSVLHKMFWYHDEGQRIKQHVFGLDLIHRYNCKRVFGVESETDAMYLWSNGVPAVAFGSANMSFQQKVLLERSPIEEFVIASDNDGAGQRFKEQLKQELFTSFILYSLKIPQKYKDVNDVPVSEIDGMLSQHVELCRLPVAFKR